MKTTHTVAIILLVIVATLFFSRDVADGIEYNHDIEGNLIEVINK